MIEFIFGIIVIIVALHVLSTLALSYYLIKAHNEITKIKNSQTNFSNDVKFEMPVIKNTTDKEDDDLQNMDFKKFFDEVN